MAKTAIVLGATGATGSELVNLLLKDNGYSKIKLFVRRTTGISSPKIEEHITDLLKLDEQSAYFTGDVVFCCIGTTKAKTPDKATYYKIDHDIPVTAAALAKENGINSFLVISAIGADKNSAIFYNRTKGEMEEDVKAAKIVKTHILRPSLIVGNRGEARLMENIAKGAMKLLNPLLRGKAAKYRSIKAEAIATAMVWLANNDYPSTIIESDEIAELSKLA